MRIELVLGLLTAFILFHIHTDGVYVKRALEKKKYFQMAGVVLGALFVYYVIKKNPLKARDILLTSNEYVKYLPVDRNTQDMITPILNFTAKQTYGAASQQRAEERILQSGAPPTAAKQTKRSVSETKKKLQLRLKLF